MQDKAAGEVKSWIPERISAETPLSRGDRIRMSVEVSEPGFLYIFDRERRKDGEPGPPFLIYPNLNMGSGNNRVAPGRPIDIPADSESKPWWMLASDRSDYSGELLTVIVSAQPLAGIKIGPSRGRDREGTVRINSEALGEQREAL